MSNKKDNKIDPSSETSTNKNFRSVGTNYKSNRVGVSAYGVNQSAEVRLDKNVFQLGFGDLEVSRAGGAPRFNTVRASVVRSIRKPLIIDAAITNENVLLNDFHNSQLLSLKDLSTNRYDFFPNVVSYVKTLNLSGFVPRHTSLRFYNGFNINEDDLTVLGQNAYADSLGVYSLYEYDSQASSGATDNTGAINGVPNSLYSLNVTGKAVTVNHAVLPYVNRGNTSSNYLHDPYTDRYVYDLNKARDNLINYYKDKKEKISVLGVNRSFLPSAIASLTEFGTTLRIIYDAIKGCFKNVQLFSTKMPVVDSTIKTFMNVGASQKEILMAGLGRLHAIVNRLPYNKVVYAKYTKEKKA